MGIGRDLLDNARSMRAAASLKGETVLDEASKVVDGDREEAYGHPAKNFEATALIWSGILGIPVSVNQVALCMVGLKLARQAHQHKRDNLVDGAGYLRCIEKAQQAGYPIDLAHGTWRDV